MYTCTCIYMYIYMYVHCIYMLIDGTTMLTTVRQLETTMMPLTLILVCMCTTTVLCIAYANIHTMYNVRACTYYTYVYVVYVYTCTYILQYCSTRVGYVHSF